MKPTLYFFVLLFFFACTGVKKQSNYISFAMSHNDYEQEKPLTDALSLGFACVEADIHLKDGELYVAHDEDEINPLMTLKSMYLDPIRELVEKGVITRENPFYLYVDLKTKNETIDTLSNQLREYRDILTRVDSDGYHVGEVKVISGSWDVMKHLTTRYIFAEGKITMLETDLPSTSLFLINEKWSGLFSWNGEGEMPHDEELRLREMVQKANQGGRYIRFWATDFETKEARERLWRKLRECGVHLISTDYLTELSIFAHQEEFVINK